MPKSSIARPAPNASQPRQSGGKAGVIGDGTFGHFQVERARREWRCYAPLAVSNSSKPGSRSWRRERLTLTNSGGDKRKIALPMGKIVGRPFQREAAQCHDQSGLLGMGDEIGGRDQALGGMAPAQQRLEARHGAVGEPHDRLVENLDLAIVQRLAQIGFQRHRIGAAPALPDLGHRPGRTRRRAPWRRSAPVRHCAAVARDRRSSCATPTLAGAKMLRPS